MICWISATTLSTSRLRTLIPIVIRRCVLSRDISTGAFSKSTCAISCNGIGAPSGRSTYNSRKFWISVRCALSIRTTKSNRFSPSITIPAVSPAKVVLMSWFTVSTSIPYWAILARSYFTTSWGMPSICCTLMSPTPSTFRINRAASVACENNSSKSSPKILMAMSDFTPAINSLNRIWIGWVNSKFTSGNAFKDASIFASSSSIVSAFVHSFGSFKMISKSHALIPIGSVGISDAPMRETTCLISFGYSFSNNFWASVLICMLWLKDALVGKTTSTAKSPSFNSGINSPPNVEKTYKLPDSNSTEAMTTSLRFRNAQSTIGLYPRYKKFMMRSAIVTSWLIFLLRNIADTIGT